MLEFDHPRAGHVRMPGVPWLFGDERPLGEPTPLLGEHSESIRNGTAWNDETPPDADTAGEPAERPLEGLRVIDLSMFMSGPMTTMIFGDAGADVIKIESVQRIDGWRATGGGEGAFWEMSPAFNWVNRNKDGITLNLTDERGADVVRHLVEDADVIVENYTPRVMGNFGLAWEQLRAINPELIMLSMPGFGLTGSWTHYTAFANTTEQMCGLPHLTGYADDQPIFSGHDGRRPARRGDGRAGAALGAGAPAPAQRRGTRGRLPHRPLAGRDGDLVHGRRADRVRDHRARPGPRGQPPSEHGRRTTPTSAATTAGSPSPAPTTRRSPRCRRRWVTPSGARTAGRWCTLAQRQRALAELDAAISEWTRTRDANEIMRELQAAGVAAATVYHGLDLLEDEHLQEREFFITQEHRYAGRKRYPLQPYRFRNWLAPRSDRPSPTLGEHTRAVLARLTEISPRDGRSVGA